MGGEEEAAADRDHHLVEAGRLQEDEQARGVDRVVGVAFVEVMQPLTREAVDRCS